MRMQHVFRLSNAKAETLATPVEQLVIAFEPGALTFTWDKTRVSVPVAKK